VEDSSCWITEKVRLKPDTTDVLVRLKPDTTDVLVRLKRTRPMSWSG
jgi:hypothetical protein